MDDRTIQKYEKEAKDKSRESWYTTYIIDTNEEEKGNETTVEKGIAYFWNINNQIYSFGWIRPQKLCPKYDQ